MCFSIPGRIVKAGSKSAVADFAGTKRKISTELIKVKTGDYILAYSGYAMEKISKKEAEKIIGKLERKV